MLRIARRAVRPVAALVALASLAVLARAEASHGTWATGFEAGLAGWDAAAVINNGAVAGAGTTSGGPGVTYASDAATPANATITDPAKTWAADEWSGHPVTVAGNTYYVARNTATRLTLNADWAGGLPLTGTAYSVAAAPAKSGSFSFHQIENAGLVGQGGGIQLLKRNTVGNVNDVTVTVALRWSGETPAGTKYGIVSLFDSAGKEIRELDLYAVSGGFYLHVTDDTDRVVTTTLTGSTPIAEDTWYTVAWRHKRSSSTLREDHVYVNGSPVADVEGVESAPGQTTLPPGCGNASGAVTSAGVASLVDAAQSWCSGHLTNYSVRMTSGARAGDIATIASNMQTQLTLDAWPNGPPAPGDSYIIIHTMSPTAQLGLGTGAQQALAPRYDWFWDDVSVAPVDPPASPPACAYDLDASGDVGFEDLLTLAQSYNTTSASPAYYWRADFNASDAVTFADLLLFASYYTQTCPQP